MKIEVIEIAGFASALKALHLPFGGKEKSEIDAYFDLSQDRLYEDFAEKTYKGDFEMVDSIECGSHCIISPADISLLTKLVKAGDEHAKVLRGVIVYAKITAPVFWWCEEETYRAGHERLCSESTMHIDCKGLSGDDLVRAKSEMPMGKELTKIDFFSYQCLRNIYKQRRNHRLPQWRQFCSWIETLPFAEQLITPAIR